MNTPKRSLLLGRRTKENLARCFHSFLQVFERGFLQGSPMSTGRNDRLKPVIAITGPDLTNIGNKTGQFSI